MSRPAVPLFRHVRQAAAAGCRRWLAALPSPQQRTRTLHTSRGALLASNSQPHPPSATSIDTPTEIIQPAAVQQPPTASASDVKPAQQYTVLRMLDEMGKGRILKWHKHAGDHVDAGEVICDIDTEVAEFEFNAQYSGYLAVQLVPAGHHVQPNQEIALQVDSEDAIEYAQQVAKQMQAEEQREKREDKAEKPR